jgi:hypothetical protein
MGNKTLTNENNKKYCSITNQKYSIIMYIIFKLSIFDFNIFIVIKF